jgi:hypothetical protein
MESFFKKLTSFITVKTIISKNQTLQLFEEGDGNNKTFYNYIVNDVDATKSSS